MIKFITDNSKTFLTLRRLCTNFDFHTCLVERLSQSAEDFDIRRRRISQFLRVQHLMAIHLMKPDNQSMTQLMTLEQS